MTMLNRRNVFRTDGVIGSNLDVHAGVCADRTNVVLGESCLAMPCPDSNASFVDAILHIFLMCTKKQVGRIDTSSVVASMADIHSGGNLPIMDFIRKAMSMDAFSSFSSRSNNAISVAFNVVSPQPTRFRLFDFLPKPNFYGGEWSHV